MSGTPEQVSPEQVLTTVQGNLVVRRAPLTAIQRAGLFLATGVGLLITCVIIGLGAEMMRQAPTPMQFPTAVVNASDTPAYNPVATSVADYKALNDIGTTRATTLFDTVVVRALLPIFTTILGYIFGAQAGQAAANRNQENET